MKAIILTFFAGLLLLSCNVESGHSGEYSEKSRKKILEEKEEVKENLIVLKNKIQDKEKVLEERMRGTSGEVRSDLEAMESKLEINIRRIEVALKDVENATANEWGEVRAESLNLVSEIQAEIEGVDYGL